TRARHVYSTYLFCLILSICFFFVTDPTLTQIYTLSLHDALPISASALLIAGCSSAARARRNPRNSIQGDQFRRLNVAKKVLPKRSEEHTSELQSHLNLVCRLLLEKKKELARLAHLAHTNIPLQS